MQAMEDRSRRHSEQISSFEEERVAYTNKLKKSVDLAQTVKQDLEKKNQELYTLEQNKDKLNLELESQKSVLESAVEAEEAAKAALEAARKQGAALVDEQHQEVTRLERLLHSSPEPDLELGVVQAELAKLRQELDCKDVTLQHLHTELDASRREKKEKEEERRNMAEKRIAGEKRLEKLKTQLERDLSVKVSQEQEVERISLELENSRARRQTLEGLETENNELNERLNQTRTECAQTQSTKMELEQEIQRNLNHTNKVESELLRLESEKREYEAKVEMTFRQLDNDTTKVGSMLNTCKEIKAISLIFHQLN